MLIYKVRNTGKNNGKNQNVGRRRKTMKKRGLLSKVMYWLYAKTAGQSTCLPPKNRRDRRKERRTV
ncbi:MAG: hypothetical protein A3J65_03020 [Candidatus Buchananbacteria bacterium RIFCSPHIGHO2_02_FULL_45_11b]|uniref:Uncharacterized protein n=1 Tax=Candidatus Buchananbacteria bacterium RIFCSPHIGHO2_02_FULL_45_11b TaxID=1797541 RepID=A0A1G1YH47_9BACT|nr:MAG: hypothetical protein A3J65_03020 [Candidatus Buchananbacteria bacterium RIFCSPHIGHO2_02_FULL_45_11b]